MLKQTFQPVERSLKSRFRSKPLGIPCDLIRGTITLFASLGFLLASSVLAFENGSEPPIHEIDREHWAYQPIRPQLVPEVENANWCRTPIDRFVLSRLEQIGLRPVSGADRLTLLRRVTFDLTGLPPTVAEQRAFLEDHRPDAYSRLVDQLLDSPSYGERWGRHWLDLARFAETDGFEHDKVRPEAWRYRDWVIRSLNEDLPYAQFLARQLAGDLVDPKDPESVLGTGFLLCGPDMPDINLQDERRHMVLNEIAATVGEVFLGLQFGCAQCHDHKADPISIHDFYRLRAYFDSLEMFRDHPLPMSDEKARITKPSPVSSESFVRIRGDFRRQGDLVQPAVLRVAVPKETPIQASTRLALSEWMASDINPLVARVIVNRVWQYHFGTAISPTPSDFGLMGQPPTHPELLDWLADWFRRNGWSLKKLHRLILTSSTYRLASRPNSEFPDEPDEWENLLAEDPENELLGRSRRRRLDAEEIRDAMLSVSGQLNRTQSGPGVRPELPPEVVKTLLKNQWPVTEDLGQHQRRSVYLFVRRNLRYPLFEVFDQPDTNLSCGRRMRTTIAPQALHMLNSDFAWDAAKSLANRLQAHCRTPEEQTQKLYQICLGRPPRPSEQKAAMDFLSGAHSSSLPDLCLAVMNLNEFVYVD
ncbi:MAG: DUF1553 domain-containing protein [Planctomycetaceae bacterium]|nr:DUF1553 domain-containing protein [Planctomycetaceae bacterium]